MNEPQKEHGPGNIDLYELWPNEAECLQLKKALTHFEVEEVKLTFGRGPWLVVSVWVYLGGWFEMALWRSTGAVHAIVDGAVVEKPLVPAAWEPA